ncbi:MAG TPA: DJ-1/PfpI family protein [Methanocorpusculum sp.]|nr:DJ-1/PfpI family protein [Methanocorpusculum sp.]
MKVLFAIASDRFMDEEYTVPKKILTEAGITCVTASTRKGICSGMHGELVEPDLTIDEVNPADYDGLVIASGIGCQDELWRNEKLIDIANVMGNAGKVTAAISLSPVILAEAGLLAGKKATTFNTPACKRIFDLDKVELVDEKVVTSGKVVTAKSMFDAKAFGTAILAALQN